MKKEMREKIERIKSIERSIDLLYVHKINGFSIQQANGGSETFLMYLDSKAEAFMPKIKKLAEEYKNSLEKELMELLK